MKYYSFLTLLLIFFSFSPSPAQEDEFDETARIFKATQVGPEHEFLFQMAGSWRLISEQFSMNEPPSYGKGLAKYEVALGGKFLKANSMITYEVYALEQMLIFGFDRVLDKYTLTIFDNITTQTLFAFGKYDKDKKRFEFDGETEDFANPENKVPFKVVITMESDRKFIYELFLTYKDKLMIRNKTVHIRMSEEK